MTQRGARVAVTGLGVICALGRDRREFWAGLLEGRRGFSTLTLFDAAGCLSNVAGQVERIRRPEPVGRSAWRRASRTDRLCLVAAFEAASQAGLLAGGKTGPRLREFGVSMGSSTAGMLEAEDWCRQAISKGIARAPTSRVLRLPNSVPTDEVARVLGAAGPRLSNMTACASSALSIGQAADLIRSGDAPGMIAGGGDALCLLTYSGFNALRLLDPQPCRPFDVSRQGLSLGEGAGVLVLEDLRSAESRGATVLAELAGYGASCDASHMTAPHPEGRGAAAAMSEALESCSVAPDSIGHVNTHGTGTPLNDATEARAIAAVFGARAARLPLTATKGVVGHLLGGAGAVEAVATVLSLMHRLVPPTAGWTACDEGVALDIVAGRPREVSFDHALSNSFGFGGSNASLLFRRPA